jgi:hypothetical protein
MAVRALIVAVQKYPKSVQKDSKSPRVDAEPPGTSPCLG